MVRADSHVAAKIVEVNNESGTDLNTSGLSPANVGSSSGVSWLSNTPSDRSS
jgi:hypothetical protein